MFHDHPDLARGLPRRRRHRTLSTPLPRRAGRRTGSTTSCGALLSRVRRTARQRLRVIAAGHGRDLRLGRPAALPDGAPRARPVAAAAEPGARQPTGCGSTSTSASSSSRRVTERDPLRVPAPGRLRGERLPAPTCRGSTPATAWQATADPERYECTWRTWSPRTARWRFPADLAATRSPQRRRCRSARPSRTWPRWSSTSPCRRCSACPA